MSKKSNKSETPVAHDAASNVITIATLARELGIDPKRARARMRKVDAKFADLTRAKRHEYPLEMRDQLAAIIKAPDKKVTVAATA